MAVRYTKARYFSFIIYPESIPDNWQDCLTKLDLAMAVSPLHDCDEKKTLQHGTIIMIFYKLLYLSYLFSLAYNIVALTGLVADILNWGITSYH
ncbi:hypothetical protein ITQ99_08855 [Pediococcus pentosaceus]|uniref:Rep family protein n=1 Tax=Pediococcus pentosaceus TaxID=1255 RepID=UPI0018A15612|nr:Rep family protein [Pediococcus pentosaceus]MBF7108747.1 hypothetical protein [Pediococcus pentosaceus]